MGVLTCGISCSCCEGGIDGCVVGAGRGRNLGCDCGAGGGTSSGSCAYAAHDANIIAISITAAFAEYRPLIVAARIEQIRSNYLS